MRSQWASQIRYTACCLFVELYGKLYGYKSLTNTFWGRTAARSLFKLLNIKLNRQFMSVACFCSRVVSTRILTTLPWEDTLISSAITAPLSNWEMSVELEEEPKSDAKRRCAKLFWRFFPHVFLILSLILYAVLGAVIFQNIECNAYEEPENITAVVRKVVETMQNHTGLILSLYIYKL